ncbi:MAG: zinc-binding dehydrogenase [Candidatus Methylomirabilales bacterium]
MKAMVYHGPGDVRYEEFPTPEPGPGEVLVRIGSALTCGTDIKTYRRGHPAMIPKVPTVFGHEWAGTVAATGPGVLTVRVGDRVVGANSVPCNRCVFCQHNRQNLCEDLLFLNGAYAEYILVPARIVQQNLLQVPETLDLRTAALVEPLACALHAVERAQFTEGETVCILGSGPMGLLLALLVKGRGAKTVVIGKGKQRLAGAKAVGADLVLDAETDDLAAGIRCANPHGRGADLVIEATGVPAVWEQALWLVRKGGQVVFFGGCEVGTSIRIDTRRMHYDEISLLGVFHHTPQLIRAALKTLASASLDVAPLITHEVELSSLLEAFEMMRAKEALKVAVVA